MLPKHPDQMSDAELDHWIRGLVDASEPEGSHLDYKQEINVSTVQQKREIAKDIVSFANEIGGTLIYGIPENQTQPKVAPTPGRPYGIDPIPGLVEQLENIFSEVITPLLPMCRIRPVPLSENPGKVCYILWTPESWVGPHMVQGYDDGRFYRRGQYRAVIMSERDVEERYRRRLLLRTAAEDFLNSEDALHMGRLLSGRQARTALAIVPLLLVPYRVTFSDLTMRRWLDNHALWAEEWLPSMRGVRTFVWRDNPSWAEVELHHNGAWVAWYYTKLMTSDRPALINGRKELSALHKFLEHASSFYKLISYDGPLVISLIISCPESSALRLSTSGTQVLEPSGTDMKIRIERSAADLIRQPNVVLKAVADEIFRAFGKWECNCFDAQNRLLDEGGEPLG